MVRIIGISFLPLYAALIGVFNLFPPSLLLCIGICVCVRQRVTFIANFNIR